jgi:7-cyano-7-deazaguanine synthase
MKSIILFSGGIDSLLTWHLAKEVSEPIALILDRDQPAEEINAAYDLVDHHNMEYIYDHIPRLRQYNNYHTTNYIPCRNALMLIIAASYAIDEGTSFIGIGVNKDDYNDYVDCRPEFIRNCENMLSCYFSTETSPYIYTPLIELTKKDIIKLAIEEDLPLELTHTCYTPVDGLSCGFCNACILRLKAFAELGKKDPIKYV